MRQTTKQGRICISIRLQECFVYSVGLRPSVNRMHRLFAQQTEGINPRRQVSCRCARHTAGGGRQLRPVRFSVRSPTTAARYQRGKRRRRQSASRKKSRPSAARLAVSSQNSPVKPSPQNKWLEPTHLKLQGAPKQKMLSCFSQSAI